MLRVRICSAAFDCINVVPSAVYCHCKLFFVSAAVITFHNNSFGIIGFFRNQACSVIRKSVWTQGNFDRLSEKSEFINTHNSVFNRKISKIDCLLPMHGGIKFIIKELTAVKYTIFDTCPKCFVAASVGILAFIYQHILHWVSKFNLRWFPWILCIIAQFGIIPHTMYITAVLCYFSGSQNCFSVCTVICEAECGTVQNSLLNFTVF